jgi:hypothetical protein
LLQVGIEMPDQMFGVNDVKKMRTEYVPKLFGSYALTGPLSAAHDDSDLPRSTGVLPSMRHPSDQILEVCIVPVAYQDD